ncbi:ABC transporter permease [Spiroplasma culicicola]|uniref:ABC transporter permease n=1 Tax=Spiroplasma culicicola AES-1 TaxID=1276246 RepID=W6A888_9MOLU|nr:ABC transporter permease [Spiroplasma culicicola]AHI53187.1 ABC transporter permease [Spiroplasma culicicola AES-1]
MKNIFKSYIKLFIKSWVETIGTIVFLLIFTMVVLGMLATPLQLSFKASSLKSKTNTWDQQMQYNKSYDDDFLYNNIYLGGEFSIEYKGEKLLLLEEKENGWFTDPAKEIIKAYAENKEEEMAKISDITNQSQKSILATEEESENYKEAVQRITSFFLQSYRRNGPEVELTINIGNEEQTILVKDVFKGEFLNTADNTHSLNNLQSYIVNNALMKMTEQNSTAEFAVFDKLELKTTKGSDGYTYKIESYNPSFSNEKGAKLNNLIIDKGQKEIAEYTKDTNEYEAYINDLYAESHNLDIGDVFEIDMPLSSTTSKTVKFKIVGIANKYSTIAPIDTSIFDSITNYGQIFVEKSFFNDEILFGKILGEKFVSSSSLYFNQDRMIKNFNADLNKYFSSSDNDGIQSIFKPGTSTFTAMKYHLQITTLTNLTIMTWIFAVIGGILLFLSFFFIIFVLKKEINSTRKQLGVFKAMGYKTSELTWIFSLKTFITMAIGIILGYLASIPFQIDAAENTFRGMVIFNYQSIYLNPIFLLTVFIIIPALFALVAYITIFKYLNEGALQLLSFGPKQKKPWMVYVAYILFFPSFIFMGINKLILHIMKKKNIGFTYKMQESFVQFSKGKYVLIMTLIGFSSFLFSLQLRALPVINDMINGGFNFFTSDVNHKYDMSSTSKLKFNKDDELVYRDEVKQPDIKYIDFAQEGSVENYIKNNSDSFIHYDNIHILFATIAEARDLAIKEIKNIAPANAEKIKAVIPIVSNLTALLAPLDLVGQLSVNQVKGWYYNYDSFVQTMNNWEKSDNLNNVFTLRAPTGENEDQISGIWLSDIAKYSCFSTDLNYNSCSDIEGYQKYLLESNNNNNNNNYSNNNENSRAAEAGASPIFSSLLQEVYFKDFSRDQFVAANTVFFNSKTDSFAFDMPYFIEGNSEIGDSSTFTAMDFASKKYGDPSVIFNLTSVSSSQLEELTDENDQFINGVIAYRLAKLLNLHVGDIFQINLGNKGSQVLKVRVAAINEAANMTQSIWFDYKTLINHIGSDELKTMNLEPQFTSMYSTRASLEGKFDLKNIQNLASSFKGKLESTSIWTGIDTSWMGTILDLYSPIIDDMDIENLPLPDWAEPIRDPIEKFLKWFKELKAESFVEDEKINYFMDGNVLGGNIMVFPLIKAAIDSLMSAMTNSMVMYILIDILLLTVLLIVIMNIIVRDSINIITIMRSLGYNDRKINWMVMGRYITGSLIAFITAYIGSVVTWNIIQMIVWNKFTVLVTIPTVLWLPVVSFIAIGGIMFAGWIAAMYQIKKQPLTYLVS